MIGDFRNKLERKKGAMQQISNDLDLFLKQQDESISEIETCEEAQIIIQNVAQKTQQELQYRLSDLCSLALKAVFANPYKLNVEFEIKRGKTECKLSFEKNGELFSPMDSSGGGAIDIASMALRIAIWSITSPKTRNTLILDEPFRFLSEEYQEKASIMLSTISKKLGIQIIMVSHCNELIKGADRVFEVDIVNGVSNVKHISKN